MSDKPRDRPTVPEAAFKLVEYRKLPGRYTGGVVHVVTDDPNYAQAHADWCLEQAPAYEEQCRQEDRSWLTPEELAVPLERLRSADIEIATLIAALTTTQRRKLAAINTYPDMQHHDDSATRLYADHPACASGDAERDGAS